MLGEGNFSSNSFYLPSVQQPRGGSSTHENWDHQTEFTSLYL